jgi:hypothetical protein
MRIISHRGNLNGPDLKTENTISQIYKCIDLGFDAEIDVRVIDSKIFLGHDNPDEQVELKDLYEISDRLWIHCKNLEALEYFCNKSFNYFWHETDCYTLTSKGIGWVYIGQYPYSKSVIVLPESISLYTFPHGIEYIKSSYGICTDEPIYYKELLT